MFNAYYPEQVSFQNAAQQTETNKPAKYKQTDAADTTAIDFVFMQILSSLKKIAGRFFHTKLLKQSISNRDLSAKGSQRREAPVGGSRRMPGRGITDEPGGCRGSAQAQHRMTTERD